MILLKIFIKSLAKDYLKIFNIKIDEYMYIDYVLHESPLILLYDNRELPTYYQIPDPKDSSSILNLYIDFEIYLSKAGIFISESSILHIPHVTDSWSDDPSFYDESGSSGSETFLLNNVSEFKKYCTRFTEPVGYFRYVQQNPDTEGVSWFSDQEPELEVLGNFNIEKFSSQIDLYSEDSSSYIKYLEETGATKYLDTLNNFIENLSFFTFSSEKTFIAASYSLFYSNSDKTGSRLIIFDNQILAQNYMSLLTVKNAESFRSYGRGPSIIMGEIQFKQSYNCIILNIDTTDRQSYEFIMSLGFTDYDLMYNLHSIADVICNQIYNFLKSFQQNKGDESKISDKHIREEFIKIKGKLNIPLLKIDGVNFQDKMFILCNKDGDDLTFGNKYIYQNTKYDNMYYPIIPDDMSYDDLRTLFLNFYRPPQSSLFYKTLGQEFRDIIIKKMKSGVIEPKNVSTGVKDVITASLTQIMRFSIYEAIQDITKELGEYGKLVLAGGDAQLLLIAWNKRNNISADIDTKVVFGLERFNKFMYMDKPDIKIETQWWIFTLIAKIKLWLAVKNIIKKWNSIEFYRELYYQALLPLSNSYPLKLYGVSFLHPSVLIDNGEHSPPENIFFQRFSIMPKTEKTIEKSDTLFGVILLAIDINIRSIYDIVWEIDEDGKSRFLNYFDFDKSTIPGLLDMPIQQPGQPGFDCNFADNRQKVTISNTLSTLDPGMNSSYKSSLNIVISDHAISRIYKKEQTVNIDVITHVYAKHDINMMIKGNLRPEKIEKDRTRVSYLDEFTGDTISIDILQSGTLLFKGLENLKSAPKSQIYLDKSENKNKIGFYAKNVEDAMSYMNDKGSVVSYIIQEDLQFINLTNSETLGQVFQYIEKYPEDDWNTILDNISVDPTNITLKNCVDYFKQGFDKISGRVTRK